MNRKIMIYTIKRIAFVAIFGYIIPILLALYFDFLFGLPRISFTLDHLFGLILVFFGLLLTFVAAYNLIKYGRGSPNPSFPPKSLVETGLYQHIRHPIYLGWVIITLGASFYLNSLSVFILTIILVFFIHFYLKNEERQLEKKFGKQYLEYKKKVPRWIPKLK